MQRNGFVELLRLPLMHRATLWSKHS